MTNIINLTLHAITFVGVGPEGANLVIGPSGAVARVSATTVVVGDFFGIPITETVFGEVEGLPEPVEGKVFLVSSLVASRVPERKDVFIPNESVRDDKGRIIGARSLGHI